MSNDVRLIAFDLDGTLTQHKTPLDEKNRAVLQRLAQRYRLLMIGAGSCTRIFHQMNDFPIDIAGNYGMQFAQWNAAAQRLESPDDIQECVYDTLTDFYLQRDQFDGSRGSLRSYLIAIADRKAIRKYRENQRQWLAAELSGMEAGELMNWERTEALRQAIQQLSPPDQQILEL